jgi:LysR family glycine cleavage system transcriptional activator
MSNTRRLPSLRALMAFETTVRSGSVSAAARALNVTPGAVSRQIAGLEDDLGLELLSRHKNKLSPNRSGQKLADVLDRAFSDISDVVRDLRQGGERDTLVLNVWPTFAIQWLVPRLATFHGVEAQIDLHIRTSLVEARLDRDDIDLAVMIGHGQWPNLHAQRLFAREFTLVTCPQLLENFGSAPRDALKSSRLLYSDLHIDHLKSWLAEAGFDDIDLGRGTLFENSSLAYQAARDGAGFALGQTALLADDLRSGRLVAPFELKTLGAREYYIACRDRDADRPAIRTFIDWIVAEARASSGELQI